MWPGMPLVFVLKDHDFKPSKGPFYGRPAYCYRFSMCQSQWTQTNAHLSQIYFCQMLFLLHIKYYIVLIRQEIIHWSKNSNSGIFMQAANIFKGPVPPVVSFSMGSLGFMTPFRILQCICQFKTLLLRSLNAIICVLLLLEVVTSRVLSCIF